MNDSAVKMTPHGGGPASQPCDRAQARKSGDRVIDGRACFPGMSGATPGPERLSTATFSAVQLGNPDSRAIASPLARKSL